MIKRAIAAVVVCLALSGCATTDDWRYPLPAPEGPKRQLNKGLWDWRGEKG